MQVSSIGLERRVAIVDDDELIRRSLMAHGGTLRADLASLSTA